MISNMAILNLPLSILMNLPNCNPFVSPFESGILSSFRQTINIYISIFRKFNGPKCTNQFQFRRTQGDIPLNNKKEVGSGFEAVYELK